MTNSSPGDSMVQKIDPATNSDLRYQINPSRVFSEKFEDQTIVIDLVTGIYYSMNFTGSIIWESLGQRLSVSEIAQTISTKVQAQHTEIGGTVLFDTASFIEKLASYALIEANITVAADARLNFDFDIPKDGYVPPTIDRHEDVKDLLLADIVHSVDGDGWPKIST